MDFGGYQNGSRAAIQLMRTRVPSADDAFELVPGDGPVVLTREHASENFPDPWPLPAADEWVRGTHWTHDIGAADLAREFAAELHSTAVLARFSRLIVDANRTDDAGDLFLKMAEGREIELNRDIDAAERDRRLNRLWRPYHAAIDREIASSKAPVVFAIHSFTPIFATVQRDVQVGVLFTEEEGLAGLARRALVTTGLEVRMNEPYSGRQGLIYSARRHSLAHGRRALEIELRQDLAVDREVRARII